MDEGLDTGGAWGKRNAGDWEIGEIKNLIGMMIGEWWEVVLSRWHSVVNLCSQREIMINGRNGDERFAMANDICTHLFPQILTFSP